MEEQPKITEITTEPAEQQAAPVAASPLQEDYLFYNVMPKGSRNDSIVAPTLAITAAPEVEHEQSKTQNFLKKNKWYVIIGSILLIALVVGGYFAYQYIAAPQEQSILANPTAHTPATKGSSQQAPPATTTPDTTVTTPQAWQTQYFGAADCKSFSICGDNADPDHDGLTNIQEFRSGTDPNNPDSDGDGISDGDEANVFLSNPLQSHTAKDPKYSDADYISGTYDFTTGKIMTADQIAAISKRIQQFGLHEPTVKTLGDILTKIYGFGIPAAPSASSTTQSNINPPGQSSSSQATSTLDMSPQAQQQRDAQRTNTIQTIGIALIKYKSVIGTFPNAFSFADMAETIKPYNHVATNPVDPINQDPYVYGYTLNSDGSDFSLSFYSETVHQLIVKHAADAQKDADSLQASTYDDERKTDLESLQSALLLYSNKNVAGNQNYVFPTAQKYKTELVPEFISQIPKDPQTNADYAYQVSATFDSFTLKVTLSAPPSGDTGYMCNEQGCDYY